MKLKSIILSAIALLATISISIFLYIQQSDKHIANNTTKIKPTDELNELHIRSFDLALKDLGHEFVAPSFISGEYVFYQRDTNNLGSSIEMTKIQDSSTSTIYRCDKKLIINTLIGYDKRLFWVEYPSEVPSKYAWQIKSMDVDNKEVTIIGDGVSEDQMEPPILGISGNNITWIDRKLLNNIVESKLMNLDANTLSIKEIGTAILDETKNRKGKFLIHQRPTVDGNLVLESNFEANSKESKKTIDLVYYSNGNDTPKVIVSRDKIIDFNANSRWVAWTEIGKLTVMDRNTGKIVKEIQTADRESTMDSPFFIGEDTLVYRYSMNQIYQLDIKSQSVKPLTKNQAIISKIFNLTQCLGYSFKDASTNSDKVTFYLLELPKN